MAYTYSALGCSSNTSKDSEVSIHSFPIKDSTMLAKWLKTVGYTTVFELSMFMIYSECTPRILETQVIRRHQLAQDCVANMLRSMSLYLWNKT
uniref:THAP-type domain-containing protein n=2 Tax=Lepeophtheirus salmonis TaxID=72036 RepID=A0A0K2VG82_LEPSM